MINLDYKYRVIIVVVGVVFSVFSMILGYQEPGVMHHDIINALAPFTISGAIYALFVAAALLFLGKIEL